MINSRQNRVLIDWLTITFPSDTKANLSREERIQVLGENEILIGLLKIMGFQLGDFTKEQNSGEYDMIYTYGEHIKFKLYGIYSKAFGCRIHSFELTGSGCKEFRERGNSFQKLFNFIDNPKIKGTRLDIAGDFFKDLPFTLNDLFIKVLNQEFQCNSNKVNFIGGFKSSKDTKLSKDLGKSIYFGTRSTDELLIYDKKSEQYNRGHYSDLEDWLRFEIRIKSMKFESLLEELIDGGYDNLPTIFHELLNGYLTFLDKSNSKSTRKEYWNTWVKWTEFIDVSSSLTLDNDYGDDSTISRKRLWHSKSVAKSKGQLIGARGIAEYLENLSEDVFEGLSKFTNKDLEIVNRDRKKKGLKEFADLYELSEEIFKQLNDVGLLEKNENKEK